VSISRESFAAGLRGVLYQPDLASLVPLIVDRATNGEFAPFVAATAGLEQGFSKGMSLGMFFSITCAEDVPFFSKERAIEEAKGTFLGPALAREMARVCEVWPRGEISKDFHEPVRSDKPVLLLSGEIDPVTPPSWAEEARKTLPNSLHIAVPGVGHGATGEGCVPQLLAKFISQGSLAGIDPKCVQVQRRPPFFTSFAGPQP